MELGKYSCRKIKGARKGFLSNCHRNNSFKYLEIFILFFALIVIKLCIALTLFYLFIYLVHLTPISSGTMILQILLHSWKVLMLSLCNIVLYCRWLLICESKHQNHPENKIVLKGFCLLLKDFLFIYIKYKVS